jgi:ATPase subunit of ABC transporter with duplicated ATPase domains
MLQTLLSTHDVAYATSIQRLFSDISIAVKEKDRIGLIGPNGVGKSTFLKILTGIVEPNSGTVIKNGRVSYVPQITIESHKQMTVAELLQSQACPYEQFCSKYQSIFSSTTPTKDLRIDKMSGGEQTKLWIAMVASQSPRVLLLDEPTNHLDYKSITELKKWLETFQGAVVFVSHNKSFLSEMAKTIWELHSQTIDVFGSGYNDYLQQKEQLADAQERKCEATKKELKSLEKGVRMRETKSTRADKVHRKNKTESSRSKSAENYFKNRSEKGVGNIKKKHDAKRSELEESLQNLQTSAHKTIHLPLNSKSRKGGLILETKSLSVVIGSRALIDDVNLRIEYGDRIAILGDNGSGKTILVKKLMEEINHPTLHRSKVGSDINVAYIDQQYEVIMQDLTVFENLEQRMNVVDQELIYKQIGRFQFPEHYAHKKASELSGGESARLAFALATIVPLDLLILDEPTNNLDIETVDIILDALNDYRGSLVVISHDTSFLETLKIQRFYTVENHSLLPS